MTLVEEVKELKIMVDDMKKQIDELAKKVKDDYFNDVCIDFYANNDMEDK